MRYINVKEESKFREEDFNIGVKLKERDIREEEKRLSKLYKRKIRLCDLKEVDYNEIINSLIERKKKEIIFKI